MLLILEHSMLRFATLSWLLFLRARERLYLCTCLAIAVAKRRLHREILFFRVTETLGRNR